MQLPIERWLQEQQFPSEIMVAFEEAVTSYKAGANRAALLFSYIGWSLVLRQRILASPQPGNISEPHWTGIRKSLGNEEEWDKKIFDLTQNQSQSRIFDVPEDLRVQVRYWKDRRNDCAHYKFNEISSSHVESFWAFVRSNLPKFVPNGSLAHLLRRIEQHFDPNITPAGKSVDTIIDELPNAVLTEELPDFFAGVADLLVTRAGAQTVPRESEIVAVISSALRVGNPRVTGAVVAFLNGRGRQGIALALLRQAPQYVTLWANSPKVVRLFWRSSLFQGGRGDLRVYASLLRNGLIPAGQVAEANAWVADNMKDEPPASQDMDALRAHGFIDALVERCFEVIEGASNRGIDDFTWGNGHIVTITWLLGELPTTATIVEAVCRTFVGSPYPHKACDAVRIFYKNNPEKRQEFEKVAGELGLTLPKDVFPQYLSAEGLDE